MKNGIYYNVNDLDYFAIKRLSFSSLKYLLQGNYSSIKKDVDTPAMQFGRLLHTRFLQPEIYNNNYIKIPNLLKDFKQDLENLGLDGKSVRTWEQAKDLFGSVNKQEIEFVKEEQYEELEILYSRFKEQGLDYYIQGGNAETVVLWTDEMTGIDLKGKIDYFNNNSIIDLKTIQTNSTDALKRNLSYKIKDMHYHTQLAFYQMGLACNNLHIDNLKLIFIDKETGQVYNVNIPKDIQQIAIKNYTFLLQKYKDLIEGRFKFNAINVDLNYTLDYEFQTDNLIN